MNLQTKSILLALCTICLSLILPQQSAAQAVDYLSIPLVATDNNGEADTVLIGVHKDATTCIDALLNPGGFVETEGPPPGPDGVYDFRSKLDASCGDLQAVYVNFLPGSTTDTSTFTLTLKVSNDPGAGFPATVTWPSGLTGWSYLHIKDPSGLPPAFGGFDVDMLTNTSAPILNNFVSTFVVAGVLATPLDVKREGELIPNKFALQQNYPNPFNPTTTIKFSVEKTAFTEIAIYNVVGQKVKTLAGEVLSPGFYSTVWNGTDDNGQAVTTGVYFVRMVANGDNAQFTDLRKLLLMK